MTLFCGKLGKAILGSPEFRFISKLTCQISKQTNKQTNKQANTERRNGEKSEPKKNPAHVLPGSYICSGHPAFYAILYCVSMLRDMSLLAVTQLNILKCYSFFRSLNKAIIIIIIVIVIIIIIILLLYYYYYYYYYYYWKALKIFSYKF